MRAAFARRYDRIIDAMERSWLGRTRGELLAELSGTVVELGAGTGKNLPHYPDAVERLVCVEPTPAMRDQLRNRVAAVAPPFAVEVVDATADRLPIPTGSADAVVSTLVLCSVPALGPAVAELRRVLKPGAPVLLVEHVAAQAGWERRVQRFLDPAWTWIEGSCHLDHDTVVALGAGGFDVSGLERTRPPGQPPLFRDVVVGTARLA